MFKFLKQLFGKHPEFKSLVAKGALIIDVRSPEEYKQGHIKGALNIPVDKIAAQASKLKNQERPIITCCRSGARSGMACEILRKHGLEAYNGGPWNSLRTALN